MESSTTGFLENESSSELSRPYGDVSRGKNHDRIAMLNKYFIRTKN